MNSYIHLSMTINVYSDFGITRPAIFLTDNTPLEFLMKYQSAEDTFLFN